MYNEGWTLGSKCLACDDDDWPHLVRGRGAGGLSCLWGWLCALDSISAGTSSIWDV